MKKIAIILSIFAVIVNSCGQGNQKKQAVETKDNHTNSNLTIMNKTTFWEIMERAKDANTDKMLSNLQKEMRNFSKTDVLLFNSYIAAYMQLVNETVWLDMACKVINGYVSDDTGLYFTLWVISRGETVLLNALQDPDSLAELPEITWGNAEFEMLMSVGMDYSEELDFEQIEKLLQNAVEEIATTIKFKDGEQFGNYEKFEDAMEDIPNVLPKLVKRAESEKFDWKNAF